MTTFMITLDKQSCAKCGVCLENFGGFCMVADDGSPAVDRLICNLCQKCVAICPHQALRVNGVKPRIAEGEPAVPPDALEELLARRRSIKRFADKPIPRELLLRAAQVGRYAPNQYKNIDVIIIDDKTVLRDIDRMAMDSVRKWYRWLFGFKPLELFFSLFSRDLAVIKKKMERDLGTKKRVVKEGTQALIVLKGDPRVSVTQASAHYILATIIVYCESLRVGSCLMDSLRLTLNAREMKRRLNIPESEKVLGVLSLGYSAEKIVNIPQGYQLNIKWNRWE